MRNVYLLVNLMGVGFKEREKNITTCLHKLFVQQNSYFSYPRHHGCLTTSSELHSHPDTLMQSCNHHFQQLFDYLVYILFLDNSFYHQSM